MTVSRSRFPVLFAAGWIVFLCARLLLLLHPDTSHSTIGLYATYGCEAAVAAKTHVSFYDLHAQRSPSSPVVEYPPLLISWMSLPVHLVALAHRSACTSQQGFEQYKAAARATLAAADILGCGCMCFLLWRKGASRARLLAALASYTVCGLALYSVIYDRSDILVGTLIILAAAALLLATPYWSLAIVALAINLKIVAILLAPVCLIASLPCRALKGTRASQLAHIALRGCLLGLLTIVFFVPYLLTGGAHSLDFFRYHALRGMEVESLPANAALIMSCFGLPAKLGYSFGSINVAAPGEAWIVRVFLLAGVLLECVALYRYWKIAQAASAEANGNVTVARAIPQTTLRFAVLMLMIGVCTAKVFSPQYMLWFIAIVPAILLAKPSDDARLQWTFILTCALTMLVYPVVFNQQLCPFVQNADGTLEYLQPTLIGVGALTLRNLSLLALTAWLWRLKSER
jgi:hypothetical protein